MGILCQEEGAADAKAKGGGDRQEAAGTGVEKLRLERWAEAGSCSAGSYDQEFRC